ncbi:unnamed protein product [Cylindrotheca closterium]|uniref:SET domain-containing protein n=1 Tax=Cylindrotheca closterium TaxID=2856 RepID=A0AAD2GBA5_9STRA|nr:unnamed protein product [Cylindrotheca closterium]
MGWGVFAGRSFQEGEIVDLASLILPMPKPSPQVENSVLDDYIYGYHRVHFTPEIRLEEMLGVLTGMSMIFNSHPTEPNLEYTAFGREPALDVPNASNAVGFRAKRFIRAGEELFSHYGNKENNDWFEIRRIPLRYPETSQTMPLSKDILEEYCSKVNSGIGRPTWEGRILPILPPKEVVGFHLDPSYLPPWDAGYQEARAKVDIVSGQRIEISTGLLMSQKLLQGSILEPIAVSYQDLAPTDRARLLDLRKRGQLQLQYQGPDTKWHRVDLLEGSNLEDIAIFPASGSIGMIRRVAEQQQNGITNCRMLISAKEGNDSAGVLLELVATKNIAAGEVLVLSLPSATESKTYQSLVNEIKVTGMPFAEKGEQHQIALNQEL